MATASGRAETSIKEQLFSDGEQFRFFQAVSLLEQIYRDRQPVGNDADPDAETVRFRTHVSLAFPPSDICEIREAGDGPAEMTVAFMGLAGAGGVLPRHYTELILERQRERDQTLAVFLDMFNHRLLSLFYRAWLKNRPGSASGIARKRQFNRYLLSLMHLGTPGLQRRLALKDEALIFYAGTLSRSSRSCLAMEGVLQDYFQVPVRIEQFAGQWLLLDAHGVTRLGGSGQNQILGIDTTLGERVWERQNKFRVCLGPLDRRQFAAFLPAGSAHGALEELLRLLAGPTLDVEVQLILQARDIPPARLSADPAAAPWLGWSSWLNTKPPLHDAGEVVFQIRAGVGGVRR